MATHAHKGTGAGVGPGTPYRMIGGVRLSLSSLILSLAGMAALVALTISGDISGEVSVPIIATICGAGAGRIAEAKKNGSP